MQPLVEPAAPLTAAELRRYARHLAIPEIGEQGQRRLKNAKVLVVGAGGLGSPALLYLAAAGVGTLGVVDFDVVEESNLQRQVVHGQGDLGRPKTESARDAVRRTNPYVEVVLHDERLEAANARRILGAYDLVVDGSDNFATRYLVNDACALLGKPYVWGSVLRLDGQASVFWAGHGPCYRCLHPQPPAPGTVPNCAEGGVLGVLCAAIGSVQVTEAVKLITGAGEPLLGRLLLHDALGMSTRTVRVRPDPDCPLCGPRPSVTELLDYDALCAVPPAVATPGEITAAELAAMLERRGRGEEEFVLVDVREPYEHELVGIPGAVLVGRDQLVTHLDRATRVVLHCKSGGRSGEALAALQAAGFTDVAHLGGGVLAW
ncbi:MAG: molybdopterin-synthase adenylyltransferase MoeB, partial [Actinomycetota bacterium]|nr:molybdopterin-synthase adenylyltransferase MoeB [Actinomycetota bacterium]